MRLAELIKGAKLLINGECTEEMIEDAAKDLGYVRDEDYLTADDAAQFLGVTRDTLYNQLKPKYKLVNYRIKNSPLGFYIGDLRKVKKDLENMK